MEDFIFSPITAKSMVFCTLLRDMLQSGKAGARVICLLLNGTRVTVRRQNYLRCSAVLEHQSKSVSPEINQERPILVFLV